MKVVKESGDRSERGGGFHRTECTRNFLWVHSRGKRVKRKNRFRRNSRGEGKGIEYWRLGRA